MCILISSLSSIINVWLTAQCHPGINRKTVSTNGHIYRIFAVIATYDQEKYIAILLIDLKR